MSDTKPLMTITIFLGILILLSAGLFTSSQRTTGIISGTSSNNFTIINMSANQSYVQNLNTNDICTLQGSSQNAIQSFLAVIINVIPGLNCVVGYGIFLFSFQGISSAIGWLQLVIYACIIVMFKIAVDTFKR